METKLQNKKQYILCNNIFFLYFNTINSWKMYNLLPLHPYLITLYLIPKHVLSPQEIYF